MTTTTRNGLINETPKNSTRIALLEKTQEYTQDFFKRIERKIDETNSKIDKVEAKIYNNFKWFLGISFTGIISIASLGVSIYQYVKH
jgi:hypothetical protein